MRSATFKAKLDQNPDNLLFRFSYAQALFSENNAQEAVLALQPALAEKPDWMIAQLIMGKAQLELGNKSEAKRALEAALKAAIDQNHEEPREEILSLLSQCN